jgi:TIR domain
MPVFISHRTADDARAQALSGRLLTRHKIHCYLDHFDPKAKSTSEITNLIVGRINTCTHLMALVTNATVGSWWVPFEIGVARQGDRRITSFDDSTVELPEFLTEWPVMVSDADLDLFAEAYHRDRSSKPLMERYASASRSIGTANEFHARLKSAIRLGRFS